MPRSALQVTEGFNAFVTVAVKAILVPLSAAFVPVTVSCAVWPLFSAMVAGLTLTATGGAVLLKMMVCVDGDALSVIVMTAVKEPAIPGVK